MAAANRQPNASTVRSDRSPREVRYANRTRRFSATASAAADRFGSASDISAGAPRPDRIPRSTPESSLRAASSADPSPAERTATNSAETSSGVNAISGR